MAKSGDDTRASGWPCLTLVPSDTVTRDTGPEIGEMTCVERSPLKATVPVTSNVGRNVSRAAVMMVRRLRCSAETLNAAGRCAVVSASAGSFDAQPAARPVRRTIAATGNAARRREAIGTLLTGGSGSERGERNAGRALEVGAR